MFQLFLLDVTNSTVIPHLNMFLLEINKAITLNRKIPVQSFPSRDQKSSTLVAQVASFFLFTCINTGVYFSYIKISLSLQFLKDYQIQKWKWQAFISKRNDIYKILFKLYGIQKNTPNAFGFSAIYLICILYMIKCVLLIETKYLGQFRVFSNSSPYRGL